MSLRRVTGREATAVHAYCLFCETQRCAVIALRIGRQTGLRCISPGIIQRKWVRGVCTEERHSWLPGYVFLYSEERVLPFFGIPGIIRWLGDGELTGEDLRFAEMLLRQDGVLGTVRLAEEGDRCVIDDPRWAGMDGSIVKVDRGRKRCCVAFTFDEVRRTVWLGYDLVRRTEERDGIV